MKKIILLLPFCLFYFTAFCQSYKSDLVPYQKENLWGYINEEKEVLIKPEYDMVGLFNLYLGKNNKPHASVKKESKYGVINEKGELIIPIIYDSIPNYTISTTKGRKGVLFKQNEQYFFSKKGKITKKLRGDRIYVCGFGFGGHCWGKRVKIPSEDSIYNDTFNLELITLRKNEIQSRRPFIETIRLKVDSVASFNSGRTKILYGTNNKISICKTLNYQETDFEICTDFLYDEIELFNCENFFTDTYEPMIKIKKDGLWGLMNLSERYSSTLKIKAIQEFVEPSYHKIVQKFDDLYLVEYAKGKFGYIRNKYGELIEYF